MKIYNLLHILALIFITTSSCCQVKEENYTTEAVKQIEYILNDKLSNKEKIIFSVAEKEFIVIVQIEDYFLEYYLLKKNNEFKPKIVSKIVKKTNPIFEKMFDKSIYQKEYITFDSKFFDPNGYEISSGNLTYFVFKDKNDNKYGEARLSFLIKPNPIDKDVYEYLIKQILEDNDL